MTIIKKSCHCPGRPNPACLNAISAICRRSLRKNVLFFLYDIEQMIAKASANGAAFGKISAAFVSGEKSNV